MDAINHPINYKTNIAIFYAISYSWAQDNIKFYYCYFIK